MHRAILIDLKTIAPIMAVVLVVLLAYMRKKRHRSTGYLVCFAVFYVYLLYVVKYTIFPLWLFDTDRSEWMIDGGATWKMGLNLIPFRDVTVAYLLSVQGMGNVLLTVPFGFGLPFLVATDFKTMVRRGLLFSMSIELIQLVINLVYGYRVRAVDVNDVLFNVTGVLIGFGAYRLLAAFYAKVISPSKPVTGVWEHMHASLTRP